MVAADPEGHEERCREAEARRYVSAGRYRGTNSAGMRTLVAQTTVGDVARIDATVQHLADVLSAAGDDDPLQVRRAKALALLANPAQACLLLAAVHHPDEVRVGRPAAPPNPDQPVEPDPPDQSDQSDQPQEGEAQAVPSAVELAVAFGGVLAAYAEQTGSAGAWDRLRPPVSLVLHLSEGGAVARLSDHSGPLGPVGLAQLRDLLCDQLPDTVAGLVRREDGRPGRLRDHVVVRPVVDTAGQVPVDAYEVPAVMREALVHTTVYETFPWGTADARRCQADHSHAFDHGPRGGRPPPQQTRLANLAPLSAGHHNLKTHHGWRCHQPLPGLHLWQTPSGHWFRVDHTGTTALGREKPAILHQLEGPSRSRVESSFARLLLQVA